MKRIFLLSILTSLSFAVTNENRTMDYLIQSQKILEFGYNVKAYENSKYHYEKAKAYNNAAVLLASYGDDIESQIFAIKSFNSLIKAMLSNNQLDSLGNPTEKELAERINYIRKNMGIFCAPQDLGKAEAYYELLTYELNKSRPNEIFLLDLRARISKWIKDAQDKVDIAKKEELPCYTGRPITVAKDKTADHQEDETKGITQKDTPKEEKSLEAPLKLDTRIYFDFDRYDIKREYIPILNEVVKVMKENPSIKLKITGYTDSIGSKDYNDKLALKRAQSVKDYLVKQGIEASRIETVGIGKDKYVAENTTSIGRFTNRRAEFVTVEMFSE